MIHYLKKKNSYFGMREKLLLSRITINPEICFGKPIIRDLRYPVELILELLSGEMTTEDILSDYPDLEKEDIQACIYFVSKMIQVKSIHKILAA